MVVVFVTALIPSAAALMAVVIEISAAQHHLYFILFIYLFIYLFYFFFFAVGTV